MRAGNIIFSSPCSVIQTCKIIPNFQKATGGKQKLQNWEQISHRNLQRWQHPLLLGTATASQKFKTSLPRFHNGRKEPKPETRFARTWVFVSLKHHPAVRKTKHGSHFRIKSGGRRAEEYHSNQCLPITEAGDTLIFSLSTQTSLHPSVDHQQTAEQGWREHF